MNGKFKLKEPTIVTNDKTNNGVNSEEKLMNSGHGALSGGKLHLLSHQ